MVGGAALRRLISRPMGCSPAVVGLVLLAGRSTPGYPSYSKPILSSTRYSTISPFSTTAVDSTTSTVLMFRTVRDAVATARRAASLQEVGLVPTISRMMITPISLLPVAPDEIPRPSCRKSRAPASAQMENAPRPGNRAWPAVVGEA